ncbi:Cytochrome P450 CYP570H1 [Beauveria bassiana ARSEF 2860]|uniref:Cytochrome P450 CYP570H1 n=1 Tax=Beauveria bassiana (strain ARSEF 2860) TaxID=655819 RepID=J4UKH0_BEAB2|nr:Cytochrome P450 CYP570H1 [Beauveria bassiana ARSEF 2860]EJP64697.1 Cytochrome P450 CYP570H1 [Beauveria bassiana ARSEF 2860]
MYNLSLVGPGWCVVERQTFWKLQSTSLLPLNVIESPLNTSFVLAITALLTLPLILAARKLLTARCHLRDFPGPFWAAYTRLWLCKTLASGNSAQIFVNINHTHGSIARVGPNHLVTSDPDLTRQILAVGTTWRRAPSYDALRIDPRVSNIVSERDPRVHNAMRRRMAPGYAGKDIQGLEHAVDERIGAFISRIEEQWVSNARMTKFFDIAKRIQFFTLDTIAHLCFGKPLGFVESDLDKHNFIATLEEQLPFLQYFLVILTLNTVLRWIAAVPWISRKVIDDRLNESEKPQSDMLGSFLKHGLGPDEAEMEMSITLIAGSDTTATALRAILLSIISTPTVYQRLINEIDAAEAKGHLSHPVRNCEAQKLPYLQAVIREGLRRFPPVTQLREREAPPEGLQLPDGRHIPGGTFVGLNAWGTQLNPVFGADAHVFRPERWLPESYDDDDDDDGGQRLAAMSKVHELIFGHGMTRCLGISIAMMNINKMLVEVSFVPAV